MRIAYFFVRTHRGHKYKNKVVRGSCVVCFFVVFFLTSVSIHVCNGKTHKYNFEPTGERTSDGLSHAGKRQPSAANFELTGERFMISE